MDFTPKPVYHNGNVFRSATEYRWALVFESLKIHYLYEVQCFDTAYGRYLPDFYLPNLKVWVEIKGLEPTDTEVKKCMAVRSQTGEPVLIISGRPDATRYHEGMLPTGFSLSCIIEGKNSVGMMFSPSELYLLVKEVCGECAEKISIWLVFSMIKAKEFERDGYWISDLVEKYFRLIVVPFNYMRQKRTNSWKAKSQAITDNEKAILEVVDSFNHARVPVKGLMRSVIRPLKLE